MIFRSRHRRLLSVLSLCVSAAAIAQSVADVTHLQVSFSDCEPGSIAGDTHGVIGPNGWMVKAQTTGSIVEAPELGEGARVLEFFREPGGSSVSAPLSEELDLTTENRIYVSVDLMRPEDNSMGIVFLANEGATNSQAFGFFADSRGHLNVNIGSTETETQRTRIARDQFWMEPGVWYRIEIEARQSGHSGEGVFDLHITPLHGGERILLMQEELYGFHYGKSTRFWLVPQSDSGLRIRNIGVYGGLEEFPDNPPPGFPPEAR